MACKKCDEEAFLYAMRIHADRSHRAGLEMAEARRVLHAFKAEMNRRQHEVNVGLRESLRHDLRPDLGCYECGDTTASCGHV